MKDTCPTRDILVQFVCATLTDAEADKIVAHLDSCESCCRTVDELECTQPAMAALDQLRGVDGLDEIHSPLPKKIGQYEIIEQIGQGGMGVVYRAVHPHLKREVALKVIRDSRLDDPTARERFVQEMQSLGKLSHQNIVLATDAGIDGDVPFIVTELLDGHDLGTWIAAHGKMPVKQAIDCIRQATTGLAHAHKAGYVHRDIKPSNLFLTHDGVIKILDLGIARPLETSPGSSQTVTGHIVGSPEFMAPEQFHDGTVDARSDIYSLGRTFAYLLNGNVPTKLKRILAKMTAGLPDQRFQTADELIRALAAATKSPKFLFYTVAALIIILAIICFMQSLSVPDADPADSSSFVETKIEPVIETPKTVEPETSQEEKDFSPRHFDITSPTGWDGFFEDVVTYHWVSRTNYSFEQSFIIFLLLRRMGRDSDAERMVSLQLSQPLAGTPVSQARQRIKELHLVANWEIGLGNNEKSDEYHSRIGELIATEAPDIKKTLSDYYKGKSKWRRIKEEDTVPKYFSNPIFRGEPSVKNLCDNGQYEDAVDQYLMNLRKSEGLPGAEEMEGYRGYGETYIISRMIEKGALGDAEKRWREASCSSSMYFRMGCFLAMEYLKAGRKNEAQAVWDESVEKLSGIMNRQSYIPKILFLNTLLESVNDTGLYDYVRNEFSKWSIAVLPSCLFYHPSKKYWTE